MKTFKGWREEWRAGHATSVGVGFKLWAAEHGWTEVAKAGAKRYGGVMPMGERVEVCVVSGKGEGLTKLLRGRHLTSKTVLRVSRGVRTLLWSPEEELEVGKELLR